MKKGLPYSIFSIKGQEEFNEAALEVFRYQAEYNPVYCEYIKYLGRQPAKIDNLTEVPFMPAGFFKTRMVLAGNRTAQKIFETSGTSGYNAGRHYISDLKLYDKSYTEGFSLFYGDPEDYVITALLPSYAERKTSSLVYMVNGLAEATMNPLSGFYNERHSVLVENIKKSVAEGKKAILFGVSFALLDLAVGEAPDLSGTIIIETGGMKGRRQEITRNELHDILKSGFSVDKIHSEYGMTELLSQAYSSGDGIFYSPPWMKILIRDPYDPLSVMTVTGKQGGINIVDLANYYSCSFIATGDLGRLHEDGGFEVLGRFDSTDVRGCNLLTG